MKTTARLAILCLLTLVVSLPAAASDVERGPSLVDGWMSWITDAWASVVHLVDAMDEINGQSVSIGSASTAGASADGATGQGERGGEIDPIGQASAGQDPPDGQDELGPMIEPIG